jgi:hypothetical protein
MSSSSPPEFEGVEFEWEEEEKKGKNVHKI